MRRTKFKENCEWQSQSIFELRWMEEAIMPPTEFPADNRITKGGYWPKYNFINSICVTYLFLSPKNQARQLSEHKPYQGKQNVDLRIKVELNGTYGRLGNSYKYLFLLTNFDIKEESYGFSRHYYGYRSIC
jgi:hypothetical protein